MLFSCRTPHGSQVYTTWFACRQHVVFMWTQCGFHMDTTWFLCGHHMVSIWLIFHHFYIISVANRSQKIANLWKPLTPSIMVWFSIRKKFWNACGVLYQPVVSIHQFSRDFGMKWDVRESSWCQRHHRHHKLSLTSRFILKSCEIWLIDTTCW